MFSTASCILFLASVDRWNRVSDVLKRHTYIAFVCCAIEGDELPVTAGQDTQLYPHTVTSIRYTRTCIYTYTLISCFIFRHGIITILTDFINALPDRSSVNTVQHATIHEAVFYVVRAEQRRNDEVMQPASRHQFGKHISACRTVLWKRWRHQQ
jgi:hypothetical protein